METFIYQRSDRSCGITCLKMALCHYSKNKDYAFLEERYLTKALSLKELIDLGERNGLYLKGYKAASAEEMKINKKYPLLLVFNENGLTHMVYLYAKRWGRYYVFDPSKGKRRLTFAQLKVLWTLDFLEVESYTKRPFAPQKKTLMDPLSALLQIGCGLLALASLFLGFYYVNSEGNFLVPVLSFSLFALMEILQRMILVHFMKKFDQKNAHVLDAIEPFHRETPYRHYLSLKNLIFHLTPSIPLSMAEILGLTLLLSLNEPYLGLNLGIFFVVLLISEMILKRPIDHQIEKIEMEERRFLGGPALKEERVKAVDLLSRAYHYANMIAYKDYVYFVLAITLSLFSVLLSGHVSLNYLLFSTMAVYYLGDEFKKLLSSLLSMDDLEKEKAYFYGLEDRERGNIGE